MAFCFVFFDEINMMSCPVMWLSPLLSFYNCIQSQHALAAADGGMTTLTEHILHHQKIYLLLIYQEDLMRSIKMIN